MTTKEPPVKCGGCTHRWWGLRMAHCSECHRTFSTPRNFDRHRTGDVESRTCGTAGLVEVRPDVWGEERDAETAVQTA